MSKIDRNADTHDRHRRNWQRLVDGAAANLILEAVKNFTTDGEVPSGLVNGSNVTFTLASTPDPNSVVVYLNGMRLKVGGSNDYTLSGLTLTFVLAPKTGDKILVDYLKASV